MLFSALPTTRPSIHPQCSHPSENHITGKLQVYDAGGVRRNSACQTAGDGMALSSAKLRGRRDSSRSSSQSAREVRARFRRRHERRAYSSPSLTSKPTVGSVLPTTCHPIRINAAKSCLALTERQRLMRPRRFWRAARGVLRHDRCNRRPPAKPARARKR